MNMLISWNEEYCVNIKEIDQQHKKLVDIINVIYDSFVTEKPEDVIEQAFSDLMEYTLIHFNAEKKYIAKVSEEEAFFHYEEHKKFTQKIRKFQNEFGGTNASLSDEVIAYLRSWLIDHILIRDKMYASFVDKEV